MHVALIVLVIALFLAAIPSQVADDLWHEFILYTRRCELFCQQAFGQFMHHTPSVVDGCGSALRGRTGTVPARVAT